MIRIFSDVASPKIVGYIIMRMFQSESIGCETQNESIHDVLNTLQAATYSNLIQSALVSFVKTCIIKAILNIRYD